MLIYGSDVWGVTKIGPTEVDKVFNWILRLILRAKINTSKTMMMGEVGMFPPSVQCHKNVLMFFQRLNIMPTGSVLKSVSIEFMCFQRITDRNSTFHNTPISARLVQVY